jgi:nucleotide-binding universal stress UspA family protein
MERRFMKRKVTQPKTDRLSLKLRHILVPMDFSGFPRQALRYAVPLAAEFGAKITLLHVIVPAPYPSEMGVMVIQQENLVKATRKELAELGRRLVPAKLRGKMVVRVGQPYSEITRAARQLKANLIVLTTHGHTGLKRVLLGSTAERVLRHASCPVLSVPMS